MDILFLNWRDLRNPRGGGAEVYTHEIARRLVLRGHSVTLVAAGFPGGASTETIDGVRVLRMGDRWTVYSLARRYLRGTRPDVVVDEINTRPFFAQRAARGRPVVALIHQLAREYWSYETPWPLSLIGRHVLEERWLARYRDTTTITVSQSTAQDLREMGFRDLHIVPNGVNRPSIRSDRAAAPSLLYIGRWTQAKRPLDAIRAFRLARERIPGLELRMVGDGPLAKRIHQATVEGVHVMGRLDHAQKEQALASSHALLVPGVREGWGRVVLEANAHGTPAIAYDVPGLRDAVQNGETGTLVPFGDVPAMANAAVDLLIDHEKWERVSARARSWAGSFDWDSSAAQFEKVLLDA